jgi:endonuclease YncB( thermonuclease family)
MVALLVAAVPATAQSQTSDEPVWTDRPVRIDRDNQDFERIGPSPEAAAAQAEADRFTLHFTPRSPLTVVDSVTFESLGTRYRLAGLEPVPANRICRNDRGERWACGLRARASLSSLLKSEPVRCAPQGTVDDVEAVECQRLGRDLAEAQVRDGHAIASAGGDYVDREATARAASEGVWGDTSQEP